MVPLMPSAHQFMHVWQSSPAALRELVEVGLHQLLAGREDHVAGVVVERTGEHVEAVELAGQHLGQRVLDQLHILGGQVGDARAAGVSPSMKP